MLSQAAHNHAGYDKITGFGYCQYPNVFFKHAPESCLWITSLEGRVIEWLRASRPTPGKSWMRDRTAPSATKIPEEKLPELTDNERELVTMLEKQRKCYVPARYSDVVSKLLSQFDDTLSYRIFIENETDVTCDEQTSIQIDLCTDQPYAYLHLGKAVLNESGFEEAWRMVAGNDKRYVQARLPMNDSSTIQNINLLRRRGFVFLGIAPIFNFKMHPLEFDDLFIMQWVNPNVVEDCPLPGATDSVAKLYGYPLNFTGALIEAIRKDLIDTSN